MRQDTAVCKWQVGEEFKADRQRARTKRVSHQIFDTIAQVIPSDRRSSLPIVVRLICTKNFARSGMDATAGIPQQLQNLPRENVLTFQKRWPRVRNPLICRTCISSQQMVGTTAAAVHLGRASVDA